ncbi:MAG: hypothetical protein ABIP41_01770 [Croceibacterium sp.]
MTLRNIALFAASGLLLAGPVVASAATPKPAAAKVSYAGCKDTPGKALRTCKHNVKMAAKK